MKTLKNSRDRKLFLCVFLSLFIFVFIMGVGFLYFRKDLKSHFINSKNRPIIGSDYQDFKLIYKDLFNINSDAFQIAGMPEFPFSTDTAFPLKAESLEILNEKFKLENLISIAYSRKNEKLPTTTLSSKIRTNEWQKISIGRNKIIKLTIESAQETPLSGINIELVNQPPVEIVDKDLLGKSLRLFNYFLSIRRNGESPSGKEFYIPFSEFKTVHGYGQCINQSFALADLFEKNGIQTRLISLTPNSHTVIEAKVTEQNWAVFDPLLGLAFIDSNNHTILNFNDIKENLESSLMQFAGDNYDKAKFYYTGNTTTRSFTPISAPEKLHAFFLDKQNFIEYQFEDSFLWLTKRNIVPPPEETIGFIKYYRGEGNDFTINEPYPLSSGIVKFSDKNTKLFIDDKEVLYNSSWTETDLIRYLWFRKSAEIKSDKPIQLTTISQFSILPFYRQTDGYVRINSDNEGLVKISVEYLLN